jgi:hypothetical protein
MRAWLVWLATRASWKSLRESSEQAHSHSTPRCLTSHPPPIGSLYGIRTQLCLFESAARHQDGAHGQSRKVSSTPMHQLAPSLRSSPFASIWTTRIQTTGPLLPGTHTLGALTDASLHGCATTVSAVECLVPEGGVLAMSPLLVHSSSKSETQAPRRVLHIEYAASRVMGDGLELAVG